MNTLIAAYASGIPTRLIIMTLMAVSLLNTCGGWQGSPMPAPCAVERHLDKPFGAK